ncbi:hypothetical protein DVR12_26935 [Chitinophaga silvatica]|uniref:Uncharacterized protein n=1 Tax=Chitinophaga silvatica TaxID=2282649 RepID=A0A3E1Y1Z0_9BACT|nr:hypothetical protein [Chitinophaga silvatica]RFS18684.1 hypothetical protein DVR12_26935 [Chitinophaga silvatica]
MFNERQFKIWITSMVVIFVVVGITWYSSYLHERFDGKKMYQRVKDNKKVYVYDTYYKTLNPAMYVSNSRDTSALIEFYSRSEKQDRGAVINFSIKYLSFSNPVYLMDDYALDDKSHVVEVIDIDTAAYNYPYKRGLVYKGTVHIDPPRDSLLIDYEKFVKSRDTVGFPSWRSH